MDILETIDKRIEELQAARKVIAREFSDSSSSSEVENTSVKTQIKLGETGSINPDDLGLPTKPAPKTNTLQETVITLIKRFDKKEFTVSHVFAALKQMGKVTTNEKHYKNRVSMAIRKLTSDGVLERTHKGSGNEPHRYREVAQVSLVQNES